MVQGYGGPQAMLKAVVCAQGSLVKFWENHKKLENSWQNWNFRVFKFYEMGLSWTGILSQVQWWCYFFDQVGKLRSEYPIRKTLQETLHHKSSCLYGSGSHLINKTISSLNLAQNSSSGEPHFIGSEDPKFFNFVAYFPVFCDLLKIFINEP